jgi:hypothetical protein
MKRTSILLDISSPKARWVAWGFVVVVLSEWLFLFADSGTMLVLAAAFMATLTTAVSMLFVLPLYLAVLLPVALLLKRTKLSEARQQRCLIVPSLCVLIGVLVILANRARPSVAIQRVIFQGAPTGVRHLHTGHSTGMMYSRHLAWFEADPSELRQTIAVNEMTQTNGLSVTAFLSKDAMLQALDVADEIPQVDYSVCYFHDWHEFNFSTRKYLFTNPAHDTAFWYYAHDR